MNKYREGKIKRTLKRELKEREIVIGEAVVWAQLDCQGIPALPMYMFVFVLLFWVILIADLYVVDVVFALVLAPACVH